MYNLMVSARLSDVAALVALGPRGNFFTDAGLVDSCQCDGMAGDSRLWREVDAILCCPENPKIQWDENS